MIGPTMPVMRKWNLSFIPAMQKLNFRVAETNQTGRTLRAEPLVPNQEKDKI